jgi:hypothetical protein
MVMTVPLGIFIALRDRFDSSEKRFEELLKKHEKLVARIDKLDEGSISIDELLDARIEHFAEQQDIIWEYLEELFDRLKNVELTVFPNLADDINQLYDIIGTRAAKRRDPLDRRDAEKKPPDKT